jgi:STE24 endopeptidase
LLLQHLCVAATHFPQNKRIVLYDTLLKQVELPELLAILGHEIGHWKLWHTIQGFVISQLYTFCLFLAFSYVQNTPGLFAAFGFVYTADAASPMPVFIGLMLFTQTFWSPVEKVLSLLMTFNSRTNEFAADAYAVSLGRGEPLASGLIKISIGASCKYACRPAAVRQCLFMKCVCERYQ